MGIIYESRRTKILDDFGGVKNTCKYYVRDFNKKEEKRKRREANTTYANKSAAY